LNQSKSN